MEEWNIGMMGKKIRMLKSIIPLFHHSSIPIGLLCGLGERYYFFLFKV
jgi:hypothetical protein